MLDMPAGATPLDPDEMAGLKFKHVTTRAELDQLEQANVQEGLQWMQRSPSHKVLTIDYTRMLHKKLFGKVWSWAGTFRRTGKNIGVDPLYIAIELKTLLDDVQFWHQHNTYPPLEAALRFHHRLVCIHPFANGNGRHARIMADALLNKLYSHPAIDWAGGHDLQNMNTQRVAYIKALRAADQGDYSEILALYGLAK